MSKFKLFLSAVSVMMFLSGQAWANSGCHELHLDANIKAVDPMLILGRYAGSAMISLDGQSAVPATVSLIPVEIKFADDGTVHLTGALTFDLGPMGTLTVKDNAVLSPTENPYLYNMNSRLDNPVGTGMFTGAFGKFSDHGEFSFTAASLSASADGRICW